MPEYMKKVEKDPDEQLSEIWSESNLDALYLENRSIFFGYMAKHQLNQDEIKDLYQDSFLLLYNKIREGEIQEIRSKTSTLLISIGRYKLKELLRKKATLAKSIDIEKFSHQLYDEDLTLDFEVESPSPHELLMKRYFKKLGKKCQKLLTLYYYKSLSFEEIKITEKYGSENVVRSMKSRCLKELKEKINGNM